MCKHLICPECVIIRDLLESDIRALDTVLTILEFRIKDKNSKQFLVILREIGSLRDSLNTKLLSL